MIRRETNVVAEPIPGTTRAKIRQAQASASSGDYNTAYKLYMDVANLMLETDDFQRAEKMYGNAADQARKSKQPSKVLKYCSKLIMARNNRTGSPTFPSRLRATNGQGECFYRNKDYLRAKALYKESLDYAMLIKKEVRELVGCFLASEER